MRINSLPTFSTQNQTIISNSTRNSETPNRYSSSINSLSQIDNNNFSSADHQNLPQCGTPQLMTKIIKAYIGLGSIIAVPSLTLLLSALAFGVTGSSTIAAISLAILGSGALVGGAILAFGLYLWMNNG